MNPILKSIIHKQRRDFERLCSGRDIPEQVLEGVWEERNIRYADDGDPAHVMDLFYIGISGFCSRCHRAVTRAIML